jgi:hypothetical protein
MGKINFKQIGTFEQFCKTKKKQLIKENNEVAIDVPFYNEAVESVFNELRQIAGNPIDWRTLVDYIKVKFLVIDREVTGGDDCLVIAHVRDLLFNRYGDTFIGGDYGCITCSSAEMGAKSLVISQLASDILRKVRINAGLEESEPEPEQKPITTVSLDFDDWDDDYYYGESRNIRTVAGFGTFTSLVKESVDKLTVKYDKKALDYCRDKLKKAAGSLDFKDIVEVVDEEETTLVDYLTGIAEEYLENAKIELNGKELKNNGDEKHILKQAKKLFAHEIAKELIEEIKKENQ